MAEYACAAAVRPIHMQDYHEERSPACNSAINNQCTIFFFVLFSQVRTLHTLVVSLAEEDTANFDFVGVIMTLTLLVRVSVLMFI